MLPFLLKKKIVSVISSKKPKSDVEVSSEQSDIDQSKLSLAEDVLRAIESKSPHDLVQALEAMFEASDSDSNENLLSQDDK